MKTIEIQVPEGKKAEWIDGVLTLVDDKPNIVETFEDAVEWCDKNHKSHLTGEYEKVSGWLLPTSDLIAYLKLRIITAALNEGWEPTYAKDEVRYYVAYDNDSGMYGIGVEGGERIVPAALVYKDQYLATYAGDIFCDLYADICGCKEGDKQ